MKKIFLFILFLFFLIGETGYAKSNKTVISIKVEGNELVSSERILSLLRTKVGKPFSEITIEEDIKRLYKSGYFFDIKVIEEEVKEGIGLTIKVEENPLIVNISIRGNRIFRKRDIKKELPFKVGDLYSEKKLKDSISSINDLYEKKGVFFTEVTPQVEIKEKKANILFYLKEGKRARVTMIQIEGNKTFSDKKLKRKMKIKQRGFFKLGTFKKEALEEDKERIITFYRENGFANAQIKEVKVIPDRKKKKLTIKIVIDEGMRFYLGERKIEGTLLFPKEKLKERLFLKTGSPYVERKVASETNSLRSYYLDRGYLLAKVKTIPVFNPKTKRIDVTYRIEPGEIISIDEIKIKGNKISKDNVIRRQLKVKPGEVFSGEKLRKSLVNLSDLGYFEDIDVSTEPGTQTNRRNLILKVDEKEKTGLFLFGAGYSSVDRLIGVIGVEQRNFDWKGWPHFVGGGQNIKLQAEFGAEEREYYLSFTNPWIYDKPISFGFDIYSTEEEWDEYTEGRLGGDIRLARRFLDRLYVLSFMPKAEEIKISDIDEETASPDLLKEEGKNWINSITVGLTRDSRDSKIKPTSGSKNSIAVQYAGLGGDREFTKEILESTFYFPLPKNFVLSTRTQFGIAQDDIPIYEKFYAGGADTIRGYEERSVGPKYNDNPIGGKTILLENLEVTHPLYKDILYWAVFFDAGNVWDELENLKLAEIRKGVGAGIRIKVPFFQIPIRIDYGYPLDPEEGEKQEGKFHFTMQWGF